MCFPRNAPSQLAPRKRVFLEHVSNRLDIELGGQIGHREVFLVERARRPGLFRLAVDQVFVKTAKDPNGISGT